jgi:hypothetical protein
MFNRIVFEKSKEESKFFLHDVVNCNEEVLVSEEELDAFSACMQ